jgi:transposase
MSQFQWIGAQVSVPIPISDQFLTYNSRCVNAQYYATVQQKNIPSGTVDIKATASSNLTTKNYSKKISRMIRMEQYELIRTAHGVYGRSIREISREYGHHHDIVRRVLTGHEPVYRRKKKPHSQVMDNVAETVEEWLKQDRNSPKKQRDTARRIYTRLVEEYNFKGGESTVRRWIRQKKQELGFDTTEAMVPLCPEVGKEAEIDWGTAQAIMDGVQRQVKLFCMRSRYSGKSFVRAYPLERQEMFFEGHIHAFSYFGGIHPVLVYDNLTTAVRCILKGKARVEQDRFVSFRSYYTFKARFCNAGQGHEKGNVEWLVGYARRNFLVPLPKVNHT